MRDILTVLRKEVLENARDRRTLLSAFLLVPLMGPVLFAVITNVTVSRIVGEVDEALRLPVIGAEHAPNLLQFATENGAVLAPLDVTVGAARALVENGSEHFVLVIPEYFGSQLQDADRAHIDLIADSSNSKAQRHVSRVRAILAAYGNRLSALRLMARGIDPAVTQPLDVRNLDVATPSGRSLVLLGTLTYFMLFSLLLGGMYLAIDATAGERERGSLEPLLCVPARRSSLVLGKLGATVAFMCMSLAVTVLAFSLSMRFVELERLGMASNFSLLVGLKIGLLMSPMAVPGAGLMFVVASFTRSHREAQTWLGVILLVPTLPILFASIANVRPSTALMAIPSMSQHLLATSLLRGDPVAVGHALLSIVTTLGLGLLLVAVSIRLYQRERILG